MPENSPRRMPPLTESRVRVDASGRNRWAYPASTRIASVS